MSIIPHFERTTKDLTVSHFFLMLGYKIFSFYLPLFFLEKGLSLPQIGFVYLLIYLPMAIFSSLIGAISKKVNPFFLMISGILGYSLYSMGMLLLPLSWFFYVLQIILGISASLFFVGNRVIFMAFHLNKLTRLFGWLPSVFRYFIGFVPIIGAMVIFLWGFSGVFILSILIHFVNILLTFSSIPRKLNVQLAMDSYENSLGQFFKVARKSFNFDIFSVLIFSLAILILGGFYQSFFLIFLKTIGWGRTEILAYSSLFLILFMPISSFGIQIFSDSGIVEKIFIGGLIFAMSSLTIGFVASLVGFMGMIILMEISEFGSFMFSSSRHGFISRIFSSSSHGAAVLDGILFPLGIALGSLFGSLFIAHIGYSGIFVFGGIIIVFLAFFIKFPPLDNAG